MHKAFRCKTCGHLVGCECAGENHAPHACPVCGSGVKFCPRTGVKSAVWDNWEVLHSATDERLAELGLTRAEVEKHTVECPKVLPTLISGKAVKAEVVDGVKTQDNG
jgi:hypothetical protein